MIGRRGFFTVIGAAVAAAKMTPAGESGLEIDCLVIPTDACILCGYDGAGQPNQLKPWLGPDPAMRCSDAKGCQDRQVNVLLGERTIWQRRTGVAVANGQPTMRQLEGRARRSRA